MMLPHRVQERTHMEKKSSTQWDLNPLLLIYKVHAWPLCPQTELSSEWLVPSLSGKSERELTGGLGQVFSTQGLAF